jgi:hypothetical protein
VLFQGFQGDGGVPAVEQQQQQQQQGGGPRAEKKPAAAGRKKAKSGGGAAAAAEGGGVIATTCPRVTRTRRQTLMMTPQWRKRGEMRKSRCVYCVGGISFANAQVRNCKQSRKIVVGNCLFFATGKVCNWVILQAYSEVWHPAAWPERRQTGRLGPLAIQSHVIKSCA